MVGYKRANKFEYMGKPYYLSKAWYLTSLLLLYFLHGKTMITTLELTGTFLKLLVLERAFSRNRSKTLTFPSKSRRIFLFIGKTEALCGVEYVPDLLLLLLFCILPEIRLLMHSFERAV